MPLQINSVKQAGIIYVIVLITCITAFIARMAISYRDKTSFFTIDLRNRVIGSRVLEDKKTESPYYYKWKEGDDEKYYDPKDAPAALVNRNTITPFFLVLIRPFNQLQYFITERLWFIMEAAVLLLLTCLAFLKTRTKENKAYIFFAGLIVIGCSASFMLHNIAGQVYILFPLLMYLLWLSVNQPGKIIRDFSAALLLTILILCRPIAVVFILPFILKGKWKVLFPLFAFMGLYVGGLVLTNQLSLWKQYAAAMDYWSRGYFTGVFETEYIDVFPKKIIEGKQAVFNEVVNSLMEDSSLRAFTYRFFNLKLYTAQLMAIALGLGLSVLLACKNQLRKAGINELFILAFLCYILVEICLPAIRNTYNAVQWIFPLLVIYSSGKLQRIYLYVLAVGAVLSLGFLKFLPFDLFLAEIVFGIICLMYIFQFKRADA